MAVEVVTSIPSGQGGRITRSASRRQRIVALMRHEASPQHVDGIGAAGSSFLRNGISIAAISSSRPQRIIRDIKQLSRRLAEMHNQIGATLVDASMPAAHYRSGIHRQASHLPACERRQ
jgi:hypothetical protein